MQLSVMWPLLLPQVSIAHGMRKTTKENYPKLKSMNTESLYGECFSSPMQFHELSQFISSPSST
jgi:hypothetical protein